MRCCLICISNARYGVLTTDVSQIFENDMAHLYTAFLQRLGRENVVVTPALMNLTLAEMTTLDWHMKDLSSAARHADTDNRPCIQDGDVVIVWVAGCGVAFGGGTALLPVDIGSPATQCLNPEVWMGNCSLEQKILKPLQAINPNGVIHLVVNIFHEPNVMDGCWSSPDLAVGRPVGVLGTGSRGQTDNRLLVLFGCARSAESMISKRSIEETPLSCVCQHYSESLCNERAGTLQEMCREVANKVGKETSGQGVPKILHCTLRAPPSGSIPSDVERFVWGAWRVPQKVALQAGQICFLDQSLLVERCHDVANVPRVDTLDLPKGSNLSMHWDDMGYVKLLRSAPEPVEQQLRQQENRLLDGISLQGRGEGELTLMVQNLPRLLPFGAFQSEIENQGFTGTYNFCYIPRDMETSKTEGLAFVNFTTKASAERFISVFHRSRCVFGRHRLRIKVAKIQGIAACQQLANNRKKVRSDNYKPVVLV